MSGLRSSNSVTNTVVDTLRFRGITEPGLLITSSSGLVSVGTAPTLTNLTVTGASILGSAVVLGPLTANSVNALVSLTTPNGSITNLDVSNATVDTLTVSLIEAETVNVSNATITNGFVGFLDASNATITVLDASAASIRSLDASNATITVLDASAASIRSLDASNATITVLDASAAKIRQLDASSADITNLDVSSASISSLNASTAAIIVLDVSAALIGSLDASNATISSLNVSSANINSLDVSAGVITSHGIPITVPTGCITMYGGTDDFIPVGWIICDGRAILRNDYPALFNTIGTIYGSGNGSTTFNIPNMIMKFPAGAGSSYTLGSTGGASTKTLSVTEIPAHTHDVASSTTGAGGTHNHTVSGSTDTAGNHAHVFELLIPNTSNSNGDTTNPKWGSGKNNNPTDNGGFLTNNTQDAGNHSHTVSGTTATVNDHTHTIPASTTTSVGGGSAFSIIPPYLSLNYIIKY